MKLNKLTNSLKNRIKKNNNKNQQNNIISNINLDNINISIILKKVDYYNNLFLLSGKIYTKINENKTYHYGKYYRYYDLNSFKLISTNIDFYYKKYHKTIKKQIYHLLDTEPRIQHKFIKFLNTFKKLLPELEQRWIGFATEIYNKKLNNKNEQIDLKKLGIIFNLHIDEKSLLKQAKEHENNNTNNLEFGI
ncbi:hypothetical protein DEFDS_P165 (plasmid) [Deferribacter desulfuricans SSM1]|uniref:Uncharacterized protein n=1 Tax=Deferribacter desulfuricans (strain DSM 14783 / JCM 11476 / NBRC 101012 / SSM1) TaxID=639282 RepID=D3PEZ3_DEFDS|nr:hypothetical protein [Deferribacter desulfuricans]BAI81785.1 hypothetical protein DEFDS_P165 [Deferribacter desulfuricans SSM1]